MKFSSVSIPPCSSEPDEVVTKDQQPEYSTKKPYIIKVSSIYQQLGQHCGYELEPECKLLPDEKEGARRLSH